MSTKTLIDRIARNAPGWGRPDLRTLVQQGQDELFDYDGHFQRWIGTDNQGWPPYLLTTAGTYRYEITGANLSCTTITKTIGGVTYTVRAKRVLKVFIDATSIDYGKRYTGKPYLFSWLNPYSTAVSRLEVADIPVDSGPALEATSAWIEFKEDPGTTTDKFFVLFVWEPMRLTSESIPLVVPVEFEEAIRDYVLGTIGADDSGAYGDRLSRFYSFWKPRYEQYSCKGASTAYKNTVARYC